MASQNHRSQIRVEQPEFSFGVITDIQYADIPNGFSFLGVPRYYRHSLEGLRRAVNSWNKRGDLSFVINLGDIVDGFCPKECSLEAVLRISAEFQAFTEGPVYHILGNHCLYNLPRSKLNEILKIPSAADGYSYYEFSPTDVSRIIVLDGYDISVIGWPEGHPHRTLAVELLEKKNPNVDKNSPIGLVGTEQRFVMFNGGVGEKQLLWLRVTLEDASHRGQKAIVFCHLPIHPGATVPSALLWNYDVVLDVLHRYRCVKACFAGHAHTGGYVFDSCGIHHRVLEAVLECPPGMDAFGHIEVYQNRLSLVGVGCMEGTEMDFD